MDQSITVRISGDSSSLTETFSPIINVNGNSEIALLMLKTSNTVFAENSRKIAINESNNCIEIIKLNKESFKYKIDPGYYSINKINNIICKKINDDKATIYFSLTDTDNHTKCRINCDEPVNFDIENSLANALGFEEKTYNYFFKKDVYHQSENIIYAPNYDSSIKVTCNIAKGTFNNGQQSCSIYEFFHQQSEGTQIVESPINLIYYKLKTAVIKKIRINLVDDENNIINNFKEQITVILHIRPIKY